MYEVLNTKKRMTRKEIIGAYKGKWVFLVDLQGPPFRWFETAVPAVIADKQFEGKETGIYDRLKKEHEGNTSVWSFLPNELNVFGFNEVLADDC